MPHFSYEEATAILHTVDRATPMGKRDYVILSVAICTGLRLGDILNLRLNDIAWRQQEMEVVQKRQEPKSDCHSALQLEMPWQTIFLTDTR